MFLFINSPLLKPINAAQIRLLVYPALFLWQQIILQRKVVFKKELWRLNPGPLNLTPTLQTSHAQPSLIGQRQQLL